MQPKTVKKPSIVSADRRVITENEIRFRRTEALEQSSHPGNAVSFRQGSINTTGEAVAAPPHLLRSLLVTRHTRTKGRVVESAGIQPKGSVQARTAGITAPGVDWVVADKAQTHCLRLEGLVP
jgi:hypothetical protein